MYTFFCAECAREFARRFTHDFHILAIDMLLDFFDLVAEGKIELEVFVDFFDAMHDSSMVFDTDLGGDFGGAELEFPT